MKSFFGISLAILFLHVTAVAQSTLWSNNIDGSPNAANPYTTGDVVAAGITASGIGRGPGLTAPGFNSRYGGVNWTTSGNPDETDYFSFTLAPSVGSSISITTFQFTLQRGAGGPTAYVVRSSEENYMTDIYGGALSSSSTAAISVTVPINKTYSSAITFRIYGIVANSTTGNSLSVNDFSFSGSVPLPLTLVSFDAKAQGGNAILNWRCANQKNILRFDIERGNGILFEKVGTVAAKNAEETTYNFSDPLPKNKESVFYRLRVEETDGRFFYSPVIPLNIPLQGNEAIIVYPNPVTEQLELKNLPAHSHIKVTDMQGRIIWNGNASGEIKVNTTRWGSGTYLIRINDKTATKIIKK